MATGGGIIHLIEETRKAIGLKKEKLTLAIQGFGNVGSSAGIIARRKNWDVIAVSDVSGGVYNSKGIDITMIRDVTPVPHNGPKPKKPRRI